MKRQRRGQVKPSDLPVMKSLCATCPFRAGGDAQLRGEIEARVITQASQTCHHTGAIHGKPDTHLCRGARNHQLTIFYRLGVLDAPTDDAWQQALERLKHERHSADKRTKKH